MGFKMKQLGAPFQTFTANYGPINLTAGVPDAELYFGLYGQKVLTATTLASVLDIMDEIIVTRRGETIIDFENGEDLLAMTLAPWFDHTLKYTTRGTSAHYSYMKGLCLPCNFPPGAAGEFQLQVLYAAAAGITTPYLSVAEGQGWFENNVFGLGDLTKNHHFHIVKRLYTPAATGWNNGFDIGTEGTLVGLLMWQTAEEGKNVAKAAVDLLEMRLEIGGEDVIRADCLTIPGREGRQRGQSNDTLLTTTLDDLALILDQYVYFDFARQPWDCKGKSVVLYTNAGTGHTAIRAYPIYLVRS